MVTKQGGWLVIDFPINVIDTHYDIITVHLYTVKSFLQLLIISHVSPQIVQFISLAFLSVQHLKKLPNLGNNFF